MSDVEQGPLPGHEHLTMGDQMRAAQKPAGVRTSASTGAVENPRREYLKQRIAARKEQREAAGTDGTSAT